MLMGHALRQCARRFPQRDAIVFGQRRMTFADLNREVNQLAHALAGLEVGAGDRIAISLANRPEIFTVFFAAQKLGAVAVFLNFNLTPNELRVIGADCEPKAWFYDDRTAPHLAHTVKDFSSVQTWIACGEASVAASRRYGDLLDNTVDSEPRSPDVGEHSPSLIMYTSGTTGRPKGVVLSHAAQWINTTLMIAELGFEIHDRTLQIAPLYHVAAFHVIGLPILFVGGCNVIVEKFDPHGVAELADAHAITGILGAPTHFELWAQHGADPAPATKAALKHIIVTGAPVRPETVSWITSHLSRNLWDVFGQTEACSLITLVPPEEIGRMSAVNCIGRPLLGVDVAHIPADGSVADGLAGAPPERGELIARGPKLMNGYYNAPEKTEAAIEDGWLRTGDLVQTDEDGYYYYLGRVDDMIITGGENVYPVEIEEVLMTCPGIVDCVIAGLPDDRWGQVITAFIVSDADRFDLSEAQALVKRHLASHKRPRRWEQISEIPRSPSGKVLVRELVVLAHERHR